MFPRCDAKKANVLRVCVCDIYIYIYVDIFMYMHTNKAMRLCIQEQLIRHAYICSHVDASDLAEVMISFAPVMARGAKPCPQQCVLNAAESEQNY